ncbi:MCE family protein [Pseudonocardia sp.]|uniref:MCE family protein n=1 Tax=Pseudonocardia sp. TaxID=60912 RepID=UPI003D0CE320
MGHPASSPRWFRIAAVVAVVAVLASLAAAYTLSRTSRTVTAYFTSAEGVFPDNSVRVLGVEVGTITSVEPAGTRVRVEMEITDDDLVLPADVSAVVISPSVVTGRYIQFTPTYSGGPVLPDGAVIPVERTAVPLGVDDLARTATALATALGPEGANRNGALADLVDVGARNLDGNGEAFNSAVRDLGELSGTLADSREELFGTVTELQLFVSTVAAHDDEVRELNGRLRDVAGFLADDREELGDAIRELSIALGEVAEFVRDNREVLDTDVEQLATVTDAVVRQRKALAEILDVAPAGLNNLFNAYNASAGTLDTRVNLALPDLLGLVCRAAAQPGDTPIGAICGLVGQAAAASGDDAQFITALRAQLPAESADPAAAPVPGLAVPTDQPGAPADVTTVPDPGPIPGTATAPESTRTPAPETVPDGPAGPAEQPTPGLLDPLLRPGGGR